ncbi:MAG: thrombospondin type 3 repeat-containing protein [Archangium sp.]|nr:thrombospondin type 3 repeat-containing protein [Archangium sp.]
MLSSCAGPPAVPSPADIFEPDPNYDFNTASGVVEIHALDGRTVCFTTDGSEPQMENGACVGATVPDERKITIGCPQSELSTDFIVGIRLAFEWPARSGKTVALVSANYTLDCTQVVIDRDNDGVPDAMDNCPVDGNPDQVDNNGNGIGDACEANGAPDADGDGRPDTADNCLTVWNVNQGDDDRDGIGNVCDPTPRGTPPLPWDNIVLARAFVKWKEEMQCRLNGCANPTGTGNWMTACDGGSGTEVWNVSLSGLRAISKFTYTNCSHAVSVDVHDWATDPTNANPNATVPMMINLTVNGEFTQDTDFGGSGNESGTVQVTGDFTGTVTSHVLINNSSRSAGSYFSVACTMDPIVEEMCAPNNLFVNFVYPDWSCEPGGCPAAPPPLVDGDGDGVFDPYDNCVSIANATQANVDFDALGDACDSSSNTTDTDGDRVPDDSDNCPAVANTTQQDTDHDGLGDECDSVADPDTDGDLIIDARDNCPMVLNPTQTDTDMDGSGDACDSTPNGEPPWSLIKFKIGRCLYDNAGDVRSTSACDPGQPNQRWEVTRLAGNRFIFRNIATRMCLTAQTWTGVIGMNNCDMQLASQQWDGEAYTQGGNDMMFPMRLHSAAPTYNYCAYTDFTADVFATQGNCGLAGTENNRKIGIYANGDFSITPPQP